MAQKNTTHTDFNNGLEASKSLNIPIKDDFTDDTVSSISLGDTNRLKVKGNDSNIREVANLEDLQPIEDELDKIKLININNSATVFKKIEAGTSITINMYGTSLTYSQQAGGPTPPANGASQNRALYQTYTALQETLTIAGISAIVGNKAYPGDRTTEGLTRWVAEPATDIAILEYGTNDAWNYGGYSSGIVPLDIFRANMILMIEKRLAEGSWVFLTLPPDIRDVTKTTRIYKYRGVIKELAETYNLPLIDIQQTVGWLNEIWNDEVHLTAEAYNEWGSQIAAYIVRPIAEVILPASSYNTRSTIINATSVINANGTSGRVWRIDANTTYPIVVDVQGNSRLATKQINSGSGTMTNYMSYGNAINQPIDTVVTASTVTTPTYRRSQIIVPAGKRILFIKGSAGISYIDQLIFVASETYSEYSGNVKVDNILNAAGILQVGVTTPPASIVDGIKMYVVDTATVASGTADNFSLLFQKNVNPTAASTNRYINTEAFTKTEGTFAKNAAVTSFAAVYNNQGAGAVSLVSNISSYGTNISTGVIQDFRHFLAYGFPTTSGGTGTNNGVINSYGLDIEAQQGAKVQNGFGIYQRGTNDKNAFFGKTGFGTNNPTEMLDIVGAVKINGTTTLATTYSLDIVRPSQSAARFTNSNTLGTASGCLIRLETSLTPTALNQRLGSFQLGVGTETNAAALINAYSADTHTLGTSHPTYLSFWTTDPGAIVATEKMIISATGQFRLINSPITSAGSYDILTRNSSTGFTEKVSVLPVSSGGTGKATITSGALQKGNGTSALTDAVAGTDYVVPSGLSDYELLSNKSTSTSLGTSNTLYPTQNAVKIYVDNAISSSTGTLQSITTGTDNNQTSNAIIVTGSDNYIGNENGLIFIHGSGSSEIISTVGGIQRSGITFSGDGSLNLSPTDGAGINIFNHDGDISTRAAEVYGRLKITPAVDVEEATTLGQVNDLIGAITIPTDYVNTTGDQTGILGNKTFTGTLNAATFVTGLLSTGLAYVSTSTIFVGNSTTNKQIQLTNGGVEFSSAGNSVTLLPGTLTNNRNIQFPDATGTLALTSDLTGKANITGGNAFTGFQSITQGTEVYQFFAGELRMTSTGTNRMAVLSPSGGIQLNSSDVIGATGIYLTDDLTVSRQYQSPDASGTIMILSTDTVPSTSTSSGKKGTVIIDSSFRYECIATNSWVRSAVNTF